MMVEDEAVCGEHWEHDAAPPAVPVLREALRRFACEQGMEPVSVRSLEIAAAEVLADAVGGARWEPAAGPVVLDAASDGIWISVRIQYASGVATPGRLPLACLLADRVERAAAGTGRRPRVIMEFPMADDAMRTTMRARSAHGSG